MCDYGKMQSVNEHKQNGLQRNKVTKQSDLGGLHSFISCSKTRLRVWVSFNHLVKCCLLLVLKGCITVKCLKVITR